MGDDASVARRLPSPLSHPMSVPTARLPAPIADRIRPVDVRAAVVRRWRLAVLAGVVAIGLWLRLRNLGAHPFWVDEVYHAWAAESFLAGDGFALPNGTPYDRAWLPTTLPIAASFALFGPTEFAARLPSALVGTTTIVAAYAMGREYANREVGLLLAVFVALDPWSIAWAREARMYAHLQLLYVVALVLLARWYRRGLAVRATHLLPLGAVFALGFLTHEIYASVVVVFAAFLGTVLLGRATRSVVDSRAIGGPSNETERTLLLLGALCVAGLTLALVRGLPGELFAEPRGGWPERGTGYYADFLFDRYGRFNWLVAPGALYLLLRRGRSNLLLLAFAIPFAAASLVDLKAARWIVHLIPIFALIGLCGLVPIYFAIERAVLRVGDLTAARDVGPPLVAATVVLAIAAPLMVVAVSPATAVAVTDADAEPTTVSRSDHAAAADFLDAHGSESDAIVSLRPEVTGWYVGDADYFLRTDGIVRAEERDGAVVHARTDTVYLNDVDAVRELFEREESGWIIASARFESGYVDPEVREFVRRDAVRYADEDWHNLELYYWGPDPPDPDGAERERPESSLDDLTDRKRGGGAPTRSPTSPGGPAATATIRTCGTFPADRRPDQSSPSP